MFLVAEIGASHAGSLKRALLLVEQAAEAGVDAIKLQTFSPEQMAVPYRISWSNRAWNNYYKGQYRIAEDSLPGAVEGY